MRQFEFQQKGKPRMPAKCFGCGAEGYVQSECPYCADVTDKRPPWCTICDERTRLLWLNAEGTLVQRCPQCHPQPRKLLAQHKRCPACKTIVYAWDTGECGKHESPVAPDRRLPIEQIREIERSNS
jgi:hypothetical protein